MKIAFTGTRKGMTAKQLLLVQDMINRFEGEVYHGGCLGADREFHLLCEHKFKITIHPGDVFQKNHYKNWPNLEEIQPYLDRNKTMVDKADLVFAASGTEQEELRSGTWSTIRYAIKTKKPVLIFYPNGTSQQK